MNNKLVCEDETMANEPSITQKNLIFKNYIMRILDETCPFDYDIAHKLIYGDNGSKISIKVCVDSYPDDCYCDTNSPRYVLDTIIEIFNNYVISMPSPVRYKQRVSDMLCEWAQQISVKLNINDYDVSGQMMEQYVPDLTVELIKSLHFNPEDNDRGVTKQEIRDRYGISKRSIESYFSRLSGKDKKNPLRIAGQTVTTHVDAIEVTGMASKYYTHDTISPVFLPTNISQLKTLLKGLYYESRMNRDPFAMTLAIDIWSQLSEYAKERIKKYYGQPDRHFNEFLNLVDSKSQDIFISYREESAYADDMAASENFMNILGYIEKHGYSCSIYFVDETVDALENVHVFYSPKKGGYVAVTEDDEVCFDFNDIWEITINR